MDTEKFKFWKDNNGEKGKESFTDETGFQLGVGITSLGHWILWVTLAFLVIALVWAYFAELDEVTTAQGTVIPSKEIKIVQNLEGGIVEKILVEEGDEVDENAILIELDDTRFSSSHREGEVKEAILGIRMHRMNAEANDKPFKVPEEFKKQYPLITENEKLLYKARVNEWKAQMDILEQQVQQKQHQLDELISREARLARSMVFVNKELDMTRPLVKEGAVSEVEYLRIQRAANDLDGELSSTRINIPLAKAALKEAEKKLHELKISFRTDALTELANTHAELSALKEANVALSDRVERTLVRSPVKGIVKKINVNTIGGVIRPAMELIEIVPLDDHLLVEARVPPSKIAFLEPGQEATVKISAYDFSVYGGLDGKIVRISADTIADEEGNHFYEILVRTDKNYLQRDDKKLEIIPGMNATVDILTGEKTVMSYLLKPILKLKHSALRER